MSVYRSLLTQLNEKLSNITVGGIEVAIQRGKAPNDGRLFIQMHLVTPSGEKIRQLMDDWLYLDGGKATLYSIPEALHFTWNTSLYSNDLPDLSEPLQEYVDEQADWLERRRKALRSWLEYEELDASVEVEEPPGKVSLLTRLRNKFWPA